MHRESNQDQDLTEVTRASGLADPDSADRPSGRRWSSRPITTRAARTRLRSRLTSTPFRVTLAVGVACGLGLVAVAEASGDRKPGEPPATAVAERVAAEDRQSASRASERAVAPTPSATPSATSSPTAKPKLKPKPVRKVPKPTRPKPVAGLTQAQMDNAHVIVRTGSSLDVPRRGLVVGIATALQESNLYNLANGGLPESQDLPNQGIGWDHDSVGLFQQRPSSGWGEVDELMRPAVAARRFFEALLEVPGWQDMSIAVAAQSVQISAFPDAYAQHQDRAETIVAALT